MRCVTAKLASSFSSKEPTIVYGLKGSQFSVKTEPDWSGLRVTAGATFDQVIEWWAFEMVCNFLYARPKHFALRGNLQTGELGTQSTPWDSIDGFVADRCYGMREGQAGTRRVTYVAGILIHLGICINDTQTDGPEYKPKSGVALTKHWVSVMRQTQSRRNLGAGL